MSHTHNHTNPTLASTGVVLPPFNLQVPVATPAPAVIEPSKGAPAPLPPDDEPATPATPEVPETPVDPEVE